MTLHWRYHKHVASPGHFIIHWRIQSTLRFLCSGGGVGGGDRATRRLSGESAHPWSKGSYHLSQLAAGQTSSIVRRIPMLIRT